MTRPIKMLPFLLLLGWRMVGQEAPPEPVVKTFTNCAIDGGTANLDGYQTASEIYKCDQGRIELKGRWSMTIEYGTVFHTQLGRPDGEPHRATVFDMRSFKWCHTPRRWDQTQMELCGANP
jgi:hypothetical protein